MRGVLSSGGKPGLILNSRGRPPNVLLHRLKCRCRIRWNLFWRDLQRDEVTLSCGEVNDLIKGPFGEVSPAIDLADGFLPWRRQSPETTSRRFSCPFDALTRPHGHVKKNVRLKGDRIRVAILQQRSRFRCSEPCWNLRKRHSKPLLAGKTMGANSYGRRHWTATDQQRFRSPAPWQELHCGAFIARRSLRGRWRGSRRGFAFQNGTAVV